MANKTPHIKLSFLFHYDEKREVTVKFTEEVNQVTLKSKEITMKINGQMWHPFVVDPSTSQENKKGVCMFFLKKIGEFYNHFNTNLNNKDLTLLSMNIVNEPIFVYHSMQFKRESNEVDINLYFLNKQLNNDKKYRLHKRMELCYLKLLLKTWKQRSSMQDTADSTKATDKEISVQQLCDFLDNDIKKAKKKNKYDYDNYLNIQVATDEKISEDEDNWDEAIERIITADAATTVQSVFRGYNVRSDTKKTTNDAALNELAETTNIYEETQISGLYYIDKKVIIQLIINKDAVTATSDKKNLFKIIYDKDTTKKIKLESYTDDKKECSDNNNLLLSKSENLGALLKLYGEGRWNTPSKTYNQKNTIDNGSILLHVYKISTFEVCIRAIGNEKNGSAGMYVEDGRLYKAQSLEKDPTVVVTVFKPTNDNSDDEFDNITSDSFDSNHVMRFVPLLRYELQNFKKPKKPAAGHPKTHHHPQTRRRQPTTASTTTHPPLTRHTRRKHRTTHPTN